jgi:histidyl-tRNA synthetase
VKFEKSKVLVTVFDATLEYASFKTVRKLWQKGINAIIYPEIKPLKKQLEYADKLGIRWIIIIGMDEANTGKFTLRDMDKKTQELVDEKQLFISLNSNT